MSAATKCGSSGGVSERISISAAEGGRVDRCVMKGV